MTISKFDTAPVAEAYARARPTYPAPLYDALGRLDGLRVADVGAGTGIASRQLAERGARVVAIEFAEAMLTHLAAVPGVTPVRGDGNALPLADASVDLVTFAQSWHWIDPARAVPEFRRVLRPGGLFAAWWNRTRHVADWEIAQQRRLVAACPTYHDYPEPRLVEASAGGSSRRASHDWLTGDYRLPAEFVTFTWERETRLETHLAQLHSKSYVADLGPERAAEFLATERAQLVEVFGEQGVVVESYDTWLVMVR